MDAPGGIPAPAGMVERARRFAAGGGRPAPPRVAASVILLRPAAGGGFQVYALRRATTMVFGGVYAFPGGA
ncbi:MAG TPA: NUDIX hydrolase, partial [Pilimelia sp.]|nr:NUDIX hydrolase [Pilimelia sp.]